MINIAICEDNPIQLKDLTNLCNHTLQNTFLSYELKTFTCAEDLLNYNKKSDIYLLDIELDKLSGIDAARKIRTENKKAIIIFITAIKEYVFDAFDIHAFNYILKPVNSERFKTIILSAIDTINKKDAYIIAKFNGTLKKIMVKDIMYIESHQRKLTVHTTSENIEYYYKLSDIETELSNKNFFRCHKSFLVNFNYIKSYTSSNIILRNNEELFMSKYKYIEFSKAFMYYLKNKE